MNTDYNQPQDLPFNLDSAEPRGQFKVELKDRLLTELQSSSVSNNFIHNLMYAIQNKRIAMAVGSIFALGVVAVFGVYLIMQSSNRLDRTPQEIFAAMARQGGGVQASAAAGAGAAEKMTTSASLNASADRMMMLPYFEPNSFSYHKTTTQAGPAVGSCDIYSVYGLPYSESESFNFADENGGYYSKYQTKDSAGNVFYYSLSTPDEVYEYAGGSFAVRYPAQNFFGLLRSDLAAPEVAEDEQPVSEEPGIPEPIESDPAPELPTIPEQEFNITDYFGEDAQILGQESINGRNHYIASWSYQGYCGETRPEAKIVIKVWVDSESFSYAKEEIYLGSLDAANLIATNSSTSENRTATMQEVANNFVFNYSVQQVRDIDPTINQIGSDAYNAALVAMLAEQNIQVLVPASPEYKVDGLYANRLDLPDPFAYRLERGFYPAGSLGDTLFSQAQQYLAFDDSMYPYMSIYFSRQEGDLYQNISLDIYDGGISDKDIEQRINYNGAAPEQVQLNINGVLVNATLFTESYYSGAGTVEGYSVSEPGSTTDRGGVMPILPPDCGDSCPKTFSLFFSQGNHKYTMWVNGLESKQQLEQIRFNSLYGGVAADRDRIIELSKSVQYNDVIAY